MNGFHCDKGTLMGGGTKSASEWDTAAVQLEARNDLMAFFFF